MIEGFCGAAFEDRQETRADWLHYDGCAGGSASTV